MKSEDRESIRRLKESISDQRERAGLPAQSPIPSIELLDTLRKQPPMQKILAFVRASLHQKNH